MYCLSVTQFGSFLEVNITFLPRNKCLLISWLQSKYNEWSQMWALMLEYLGLNPGFLF